LARMVAGIVISISSNYSMRNSLLARELIWA